MKFKRWLMAIGIIVSVGMLQVAQRNTVYLKGYALGDRVEKEHEGQTEVSWLETRVMRLTSPDHLSDMAQERHLNLVAWSMLTPDQAQRFADTAEWVDTRPAPAVAQAQPHETVQLADGRDTTD